MIELILALGLLGQAAATEKAKKDPIPPLSEEIVVTAAQVPQPALQATAFADVLSAGELERTPALTLDDTLRRVPGFSLFRRTSSLTAHPTTQGVSLRGIGPSGASRTLVLFDGLPLNDPFGGWVYWNRFPKAVLDRVEIVRGASSQLYGSSSMGGVIHLLPRAPDRRLAADMKLGNASVFDLEALASDRKGEWGWLASGRVFDTGGYFVVPESQRGAVDEPAASNHQSFFGRLHHRRGHLGVNLYREKRENGTALQRNQTSLKMVEGGLQGGRWDFDFHLQHEVFENRFSRITPDRSAEFPTGDQRFESVGAGASFVWRASPALLAGADWRYVSWEGNRQNFAGAFVQTLTKLHPRLEWQNGVRLDAWRNRRSHVSVNPRSGLLFQAAARVTMRASAYRGFRAPTLNELYRPFRVGNVLTLANPDLDQERLWGVEGGVDLFPAADWLVRVNVFSNWLLDPVGNVTRSVSPDLILRQRANSGRAEVRGVEAESIKHWDSWRVRVSYLYSDAVLQESGLRLPQTPRHQGVVGLDYEGVRFRAGADARWVGPQFDDDLNLFKLGGYWVLDAFFSKPVSERFDLFLQVQNVLNRAYPVGATPVQRLGEPRLFQAGIRVRLAGPWPSPPAKRRGPAEKEGSGLAKDRGWVQP